VVEELVDLFESSPVEPLAMGVFRVLRGAGGVGGVTHLGEVVDDGLDNLAPPADVGKKKRKKKSKKEKE